MLSIQLMRRREARSRRLPVLPVPLSFGVLYVKPSLPWLCDAARDTR